jgi:hypothetical protein
MYSLWYRLGRLLVIDDIDNFAAGGKKDRAFPTNPKTITHPEGHIRRYILSRYEVGELNRIVTDHLEDLRKLKAVIQRYDEVEEVIDWRTKDDCLAVMGCCCMDEIRREEIFHGPSQNPQQLITDFGPFDVDAADGHIIRDILKQKKAGSEVTVYTQMKKFEQKIWFAPCSTGESHEENFNYPVLKYHHRH